MTLPKIDYRENNIIPRIFSLFGGEVAAVTLATVVYIRTKHKDDQVLKTHEAIHVLQCEEMIEEHGSYWKGVFAFWKIYFSDYFKSLWKTKHHPSSYFNIRFEQEAYGKEVHLWYLELRKKGTWKNYDIYQYSKKDFK